MDKTYIVNAQVYLDHGFREATVCMEDGKLRVLEKDIAEVLQCPGILLFRINDISLYGSARLPLLRSLGRCVGLRPRPAALFVQHLRSPGYHVERIYTPLCIGTKLLHALCNPPRSIR